MITLKFKSLIHRSAGVLGCLLACLLTARLFYLQEYIWASIYSGLTCLLIYRFIRDYSNPDANYGANYAIIICSILPIYRAYSDYKRDLRLDKYSLAYNKTRQSLGIPIIPPAWHTDFKWDRSVEWKGKDGGSGHERKYIGFDSLYKIEYERDEYNFKSIHDTTRSISILFRYARGKSRDSIFYWYNLKDTTLTISRHKADSIFGAANIKKDY